MKATGSTPTAPRTRCCSGQRDAEAQREAATPGAPAAGDGRVQQVPASRTGSGAWPSPLRGRRTSAAVPAARPGRRRLVAGTAPPVRMRVVAPPGTGGTVDGAVCGCPIPGAAGPAGAGATATGPAGPGLTGTALTGAGPAARGLTGAGPAGAGPTGAGLAGDRARRPRTGRRGPPDRITGAAGRRVPRPPGRTGQQRPVQRRSGYPTAGRATRLLRTSVDGMRGSAVRAARRARPVPGRPAVRPGRPARRRTPLEPRTLRRPRRSVSRGCHAPCPSASRGIRFKPHLTVWQRVQRPIRQSVTGQPAWY